VHLILSNACRCGTDASAQNQASVARHCQQRGFEDKDHVIILASGSWLEVFGRFTTSSLGRALDARPRIQPVANRWLLKERRIGKTYLRIDLDAP
jgi:hypothetical protein